MSGFGSQNPYYGSHQMGGGGYLAPSQGGFQGTPGGEERKATNQSLRPVNIAQINMAEQSHGEGDFAIEGTPVTMITVVAQVLQLHRQTTADVYRLSDGSGEIDARHWKERAEGMSMETDDEEGGYANKYIKVLGTIRMYQNRRHINATIVRLVDDPMEAIFHFNEVMAVSMLLKLGPPQGSAAPIHGSTSASISNYAHSSRPVKDEHDDLGFGPVETAIIRFLKANSNADGHHVKAIMKGIASTLKAQLAASGHDAEPEAIFAGAADNLVSQGIIFSTIDEDHYTLV